MHFATVEDVQEHSPLHDYQPQHPQAMAVPVQPQHQPVFPLQPEQSMVLPVQPRPPPAYQPPQPQAVPLPASAWGPPQQQSLMAQALAGTRVRGISLRTRQRIGWWSGPAPGPGQAFAMEPLHPFYDGGPSPLDFGGLF